MKYFKHKYLLCFASKCLSLSASSVISLDLTVIKLISWIFGFHSAESKTYSSFKTLNLGSFHLDIIWRNIVMVFSVQSKSTKLNNLIKVDTSIWKPYGLTLKSTEELLLAVVQIFAPGNFLLQLGINWFPWELWMIENIPRKRITHIFFKSFMLFYVIFIPDWSLNSTRMYYVAYLLRKSNM